MDNNQNDLEFAGDLFLEHMQLAAIKSHRRSLLSKRNRPEVFRDTFVVNGVSRVVEIPMQEWLIALDFLIEAKQ